jgi:hypothetical protein
MRRAGVGPWTATVVASSYVLLGLAKDDVAGFHPARALGLGQLISPTGGDPASGLGALVCGALSIMGHNMGVVLVGIVGVAALLRRGWRAAAFHVLPLATMYVAWWLWARPPSGGYVPGMWRAFADWMRFGISGIFTAVGHYSTEAAALATVLVLGLVVAWVPNAGRRLREDGAAPAALLCGVPVLLAAIFPSRALLGVHGGAHGRFLWVTVALTLPAMAVATDALIRRRRVLAAPMLLLFMVGIPANFRIVQANLVLDPYQAVNRALFLALSSSPLLDTTPGWVVPAPGTIVLSYQTSLAWLQRAKADGRCHRRTGVLSRGGRSNTARLSVVSARRGLPGSAGTRYSAKGHTGGGGSDRDHLASRPHRGGSEHGAQIRSGEGQDPPARASCQERCRRGRVLAGSLCPTPPFRLFGTRRVGRAVQRASPHGAKRRDERWSR